MSSANLKELEMELGDLLQEFETVVEEMTEPSQSAPYVYEHLLNDAKRRTGMGDGVSDSGIEDSDYGSERSMGNSLNTSEEELRTAGMTAASKAKLGDTDDLQSFIDNLDRELAEM
ncbi:regulator of cell cycle RGCC [Chanos chanos]|uniref:Regulator of cell cycle RGCC n=1 Tax=Chanos chanos TaxID=29144 RepID=A0A6J2UTH3_CHACN|nr:regulator of cell cycle RGCC-like [Chanos chanos]